MTVQEPAWNGFHHIALVTPDMAATIAFYVGTLGLTVTRDFPPEGPRGRHCLISVGGASGSLLHFFERADAVITPYPLARGVVFLPKMGALHHVALSLPDAPAGEDLRDRLVASDIPVSPIMDQGPLQDILFTDNNGLLVEAAWPKA